jgi:hypothetical protein
MSTHISPVLTLTTLVGLASRVNSDVLYEPVFFVENFITVTTSKYSAPIVKHSNVSHQTFPMGKHSAALYKLNKDVMAECHMRKCAPI